MKLNAPTKFVWIIALVLGILGLLGAFITLPVLTGLSTWIIALAWLLLIISTAMKGI